MTSFDIVEIAERENLIRDEPHKFIYSAFNNLFECIKILNLIYKHYPKIFKVSSIVIDTALQYLYTDTSQEAYDAVNWLVEKRAVFSPENVYKFESLKITMLLTDYFIKIYPHIIVYTMKKRLNKNENKYSKMVIQKYLSCEDTINFILEGLLRTDKSILKQEKFVMSLISNDNKPTILKENNLIFITIVAIVNENIKVMECLYKKYKFKYFNIVPWYNTFSLLISSKRITCLKWVIYRKYKIQTISQEEGRKLIHQAIYHLPNNAFQGLIYYLYEFCGYDPNSKCPFVRQVKKNRQS